MTDGAALEMQKLLYDTWTASAALKALIGNPARVYDRVPADVVFPYVALGEAQEVDDSVECIDGSEHFFTCHVWTRDAAGQGQVIAKRIGAAMNAAIAALEAAGTQPTSQRLGVIHRQSAHYFDDQDGLSVHGVLTYRALTEPNS